MAIDLTATQGDRRRPATEARALLSQCKELARAKLSRIIGDALDKVENDLFEQADHSGSRAEQQVLLEAMSQVKEHRHEIADAFDSCFVDIFDRRLNSSRTPLTESEELSLESLSLVDENAIEESLAIGELARKSKNAIDPDQVMGIQARFGHLMAEESLSDEANPLSLDAIFEALRQACAKIPGDFAVKRSLLCAVQPYIARGIGTVYADVNQNLIAHQVLPRIKHQVQRARNPTHSSQPMGLSEMLAQSQAVHTSQMLNLSQINPAMAMALSQPLPAGMTLSNGLDLSALLNTVLSGTPAARQQVARMMSDPGRYSMDGMMSTPATPALMASLSQLQANVATGMGSNELLGALDQQVRSQSHPLDQLTIELVTMVFDYILNDKDVPDSVKAEISRLQIVAVKAALLDRTFFARRHHPMRQLLDRIAGAAQDPEIDVTAEAPFVQGLRKIVADVVRDFDADLELFTTACERLETLIAGLTQAQRQQIDSTTAGLVREEERQAAHATATAQLRQRITPRTPGFVREFLYQWWTQILADAQVHARRGEDSWDERLAVADALVWSGSPLKTADVQKLAAMLPKLMRDLQRGMNAIAMPEEARTGFFNQLMQTQTGAVNNAKALARSKELPVQDLMQLHAQPMEVLQTEVELEAAAEAVRGPSSAIDVGDLYLHSAKSLERGAVVEFVEEGQTTRAKLSWTSPKGSILLFTSSAGARQFSPEALAEALQQGNAKVIESTEDLMDRVVEAIVKDSAALAA